MAMSRNDLLLFLGFAIVVLASLLQFWLSQRQRPDSAAVLRHNLVAGLLCLAASLLVRPFAELGMKLTSNLLDGLSTLALGLLLIRICGLTAFRVLLPAMRITPPAILEDILLVLTYIAWGMVRLRTAVPAKSSVGYRPARLPANVARASSMRAAANTKS